MKSKRHHLTPLAPLCTLSMKTSTFWHAGIVVTSGNVLAFSLQPCYLFLPCTWQAHSGDPCLVILDAGARPQDRPLMSYISRLTIS